MYRQSSLFPLPAPTTAPAWDNLSSEQRSVILELLAALIAKAARAAMTAERASMRPDHE